MGKMNELLVEFAEFIYPENTRKQDRLMDDIIWNMNPAYGRLSDLTPRAFKEAYERDWHVPLQPDTYVEDMVAILNWNLIREMRCRYL